RNTPISTGVIHQSQETELKQTNCMETALISRQARKGRSDLLIQKRNEVLVLRFLHYTTKTLLQYQDIIIQLSKEFFISERRIVDLVFSNSAKLKQIDFSKVTKPYLNAASPLLKW
ncbi:MAG: hypothetical protein DI598_18180, partial [Pseudopedobacter saltans]